MFRRPVLIAAVVVVVALAAGGAIFAASGGDGGGGSAGPPGKPAASAKPKVAATATTTTTALPPLQPDGTVTAGRPPQFVVVSFDGAGSLDLMRYWTDLAQANRARFSFFLSGVYLLDPAHKSVYVGPQHAPGASSVGFANPPDGMPSEQYMTALVQGLLRAQAAGHEVGTHYNGHFCSGVPNPVGTWSGASWANELDQFNALAANISKNNGFASSIPNPLPPGGVVGGRTPCLEGKMELLYPVLAARGFRYDASRTGSMGQWPQKYLGLWTMTLDSIPLVGLNRSQLSMDYNLYYGYAGAKPVAPERAAQISDQAYQSYADYFERSYKGNRAPIDLGNHFENWNDGAYSKALARFVQTECTRPEVRCVSYRDLTDWLDARTPQQLAAFQAGAFPVFGAPAPEPAAPAPPAPPAAPAPKVPVTAPNR